MSAQPFILADLYNEDRNRFCDFLGFVAARVACAVNDVVSYDMRLS